MVGREWEMKEAVNEKWRWGIEGEGGIFLMGESFTDLVG